jgi:hypothetical protein
LIATSWQDMPLIEVTLVRLSRQMTKSDHQCTRQAHEAKVCISWVMLQHCSQVMAAVCPSYNAESTCDKYVEAYISIVMPGCTTSTQGATELLSDFDAVSFNKTSAVIVYDESAGSQKSQLSTDEYRREGNVLSMLVSAASRPRLRITDRAATSLRLTQTSQPARTLCKHQPDMHAFYSPAHPSR